MTKKVHCLAVSLLLAGCGVATAPAPAPDNEQAPRSESSAAAPEEVPSDSNAQASERGQAPPRRSEAEAQVSACLVQDGERISENALRAVGTEPFWAADVTGRCVTYSTPEDQAGTRVWTRFEGRASNGRWTGALDRQKFVMVTRPEPGCSDGMSDKRYPIAVSLTVRGEERVGCADPR